MLNLWELLASLPGTWYSYGARRPALKFQPGLSSRVTPGRSVLWAGAPISYSEIISQDSCRLGWRFRDSVIIGLQSLRPGRSLQFPLLER